MQFFWNVLGTPCWRVRRFLAVRTILCMALLACAASSLSGEIHNAGRTFKYVTVPVYYLTDRNLDGDTFGNERRYSVNCQHDMYYGTAYLTLENKESIVPSPKLDLLGWKFSNTRPAKISQKDRIDPGDAARAKKNFFAVLAEALARSGDNRLCVYVHGVDMSFEETVQDAATMSYHLQYPQVVYSWPSTAKMLEYSVDSGNVEWSQAHFNMFLIDLFAFNTEHPVNLVMVAHSAGNRLIIRAAPLLFRGQLVEDFELVSPDIDTETCRHYILCARHFQRPGPGARVHLYSSGRDKMLGLSQKLFGGYRRLGQVRTVQSKKTHPSNKSVPAPSTSPAANQPPEATTGGGTIKARHGLECIDFTALDEGFTGHSIPFALLADMIRCDRPGGGLTLVPVDLDGASTQARSSTRASTQDRPEGSHSSSGQWVVRRQSN
jgi:esterase/lipase superfamily enzyme